MASLPGRWLRPVLAFLALLFLVAHLQSLPPTLDDIDGINFALGVRDFDVARHQPHPPGYPLFIALGKMSTPVLRALGASSPEVHGLAMWSALGGALLILLLFSLWHAIGGSRGRALIAAMITAACPLFWFTALRPLSDVAGLAVAVASLTLLVRALPGGWTAASEPGSARALYGGALFAGLAVGFRSQAALITGPLLLLALIAPGTRSRPGVRVIALVAAALGVSLWAVPLLVASSGPSAYLAALGSQAGEDFSGVVMLWTNRTLPTALFAVLNTFVLPWDSVFLAGCVLAAAAGGMIVLMVQVPRQMLLLAVMFGPYAIFHLLFQETVTIRYALPLVLAVAYLVACTLSEAPAIAAAGATLAVVTASLWLAVPAGVAYGRSPSPTFRVLEDLRAATPPASLVGMHRRVWTESRRARLWAGEPFGQVLAAPRDYEWLELTRAWRQGDAPVTAFLADPRRIDLAVIDPISISRVPYRWPFARRTYVGGARPDEIDLLSIARPGWFLERGWALSPEIAGITGRDATGPPQQPSVGWIRRRAEATQMMIGGRHLGVATDAAVRVVVAIDDQPVLTFDVAPGFFLRFQPLEAGALDGAGPFAQLTVRAEPTTAGAAPALAIEQFDLQAPEAVQVGYDEGWHEPEYNVQTGRSWRWMSERASLVVRSAPGEDVVLRVSGESPLRYYSRPSTLTIAAATQNIAVLTPASDFVEDVRIPASALAAAGGRVTFTTDQMFIPGDREGTADRRHLALRIYSVATARR